MTSTRLPTEVQKENLATGNDNTFPTEDQMSAKQSSESYDRYNIPTEDEKKIVEEAKAKKTLTQKFKEGVDNTIGSAKSYVNQKVENVESNLNKSLTTQNYKKIAGNIIRNAGSNLKNDVGFLGNQVISSGRNIGLSEKQSAKKYGDVQYPNLFGGVGGYSDIITKDKVGKKNIKQVGSFNQNENNQTISKNNASIDIFKTGKNPVLDTLKKKSGSIKDQIDKTQKNARADIIDLQTRMKITSDEFDKKIAASTTPNGRRILRKIKKSKMDAYEYDIIDIRNNKRSEITQLEKQLVDVGEQIDEAPRSHNPMSVFYKGRKQTPDETKDEKLTNAKLKLLKSKEEKERSLKLNKMGSLNNRMNPFTINLKSNNKNPKLQSIGMTTSPFGTRTGISSGISMDPFAAPVKKSHHKQIPGQPPQPDHPKKMQSPQSIGSMRDPFAAPVKKSHHKQVPIKQKSNQQSTNDPMRSIFGITKSTQPLKKSTQQSTNDPMRSIFGIKKSTQPLKRQTNKLSNNNMQDIFGIKRKRRVLK